MTLRANESDAVVMLAAGRGSRAGGPKALHAVAGRVWWQIQHESLMRLGRPVTWVVSSRVAEAWRGEAGIPNHVVIAANDEQPMFASVLAGLLAQRRSPPMGVFILPVDVPAPREETWRALAAERDRPARPAVNGIRGHPVRLPWEFIERTVLPIASDAARVPAARLDHLIANEAVTVPVNDERVGWNLNLSADFERWSGSPDGR